MIDTEKTPAEGTAAVRRRRGRAPRQGPATFVDYSLTLPHAGVVEDVRVTAGGTRLFTRIRLHHAVPQASAGTVWVWSPGEVTGTAIMGGEVSGIDPAPDGRVVALWSIDKGYFNVIEPTTLRSLTVGWRSPRIGRWGVRFDPRAAALAPEADGIALLGERGQLAVYRPVDAIGPDVTLAEGVRGVGWSPDGERIAVVDGAEIALFDVATGDRVWRAPRPRPFARACHVAWDPAGRFLLVVDADLESPDAPLTDGRRTFVERSDPHGGPELRWTQDGSLAALLPYETTARQIAWSDDGARCLLVARPGGVLVWDVERHQPLVHDPAVATASFGPRGEWMALAEDGARTVLMRWLP